LPVHRVLPVHLRIVSSGQAKYIVFEVECFGVDEKKYSTNKW
jgi:hypothetical protein